MGDFETKPIREGFDNDDSSTFDFDAKS